MTITEYISIQQKQNHGKAAPSEHELQVVCVKWFRYTYPNEIIMAIPNGGYRTPKTAAIMKAEGQLAGVPDLFIPTANKQYHGLWIEMKNGKAGRLSEYQKQMHQILRNHGYEVDTCRDSVQFRDIVSKYLKS
jgi:hypothetical protein